jgi:aminopeptidase S
MREPQALRVRPRSGARCRPAGKERHDEPEIIEFVGNYESPLIEAGIPVVAAESGHDEEKTCKRQSLGEVGEVYDRCYHGACDTMDNVNRDMFNHYMRVAGTLGHFATSTEQLL